MDANDRPTRLRLARENAGFDSPRAAAKHFNWNENTYKSRENGLRDFGVDEAQIYGRAFNVSWIWLVSGQGEVRRNNVVTLSGLIGAGGEIDVDFKQAYGENVVEIEVLVPIPIDVQAYEVWGDSMLPRYEAGDVVLIRKIKADPWEYLDRVALVTTEDGRRLLKRIRKGDEASTFHLESFNAALMKNVRISEIGAVHLVIPNDQVLRLSGAKEIQRRLELPIKSAH